MDLFMYSLSPHTDNLNPNFVGFEYKGEYFKLILSGEIQVTKLYESDEW